MLPLLTAQQMRLCDQYTIQELHIPSRTLMERAAHSAIDVMKTELTLLPTTRIIALCGSGNNGGDGFAMARFLFDEGYDVTVCYGGSWSDTEPDTARMSVECAVQYDLWQLGGGKTLATLPKLKPHSTIVIDALFGIGLDRPVVGHAAEWIDAVNAAARQGELSVLSVDIPSGICANTGRVLGSAIRADVTATMAYPKTGLLLYPGAAHAGRVKVCDIGITTQTLDNTVHTWLVTPTDLAPILDRPAYANKGTFGRVLVIGGFPGMCGAAYLAAKSAYRTGCGLVEIMSAEQNRIPLQTLLPEAVFTPFDPSSIPSDNEISAILARADAVVLGCGLGQSDAARALTMQVIRLCQAPLVLDADALNLVAVHEPLQGLLRARTAPTVLTPHLGEAARLSGLDVPRIASDLITTASDLAQNYHATCVLKDARTVISDGTMQYIQTQGNSGMATGGSGDCLGGIIASLLAQHRVNSTLSSTMLASLGVLLHAMAGDAAAKALGEHALMAGDIADAVGEVLKTASQSKQP